MARPRKWASETERIAAYREQKRKALEDPDLPARDVDEPPARPTVTDAAPEPDQELAVSLEDYVAQAVKEAAAYADSIGETDDPYPLIGDLVLVNRRKDRIARAEAYARWRYQGVLSGEVSSL